MPLQTPVFIIGTDTPCLILAIALHRYAISVLIIDRKEPSTTPPNLINLDPYTRELLEDLGLSDKMTQQKQPLTQNQFDAILIQYLTQHEIFIERGTTLINVTNRNKDHELTLQSNHQTQHLLTRFIIACDQCILEPPLLQQGSIFFINHIINTGMQDAYNLAWKLALVLNNDAHEKILDSYQEERNPQLIKKKPFIDYDKSSIIYDKSTISNRSPQPGELAPEIKFKHNDHFTYYLRGTKHHLLVFCGDSPSKATLKRINALSQELTHYRRIIDIVLIVKTTVNLDITQIIDADFSIHQRFNVIRPALCLIRPDKYIAFCSATLDIQRLKKYLRKFFNSRN